jgi:hypothetical protein
MAPAVHLPSVPHGLVAPWSVHVLLGSGVPATLMGAQVPVVAAVSALRHDWHLPLHALVQQTLLPEAVTQLVLRHWVFSAVALHVAPLASLGTHWLAEQ